MRTAYVALALTVALVLTPAVDTWLARGPGETLILPARSSATAHSSDPHGALQRGDLEAIQRGGSFRIMVRQGPGGLLITPAEQALILQFAQSHGLTPQWIGAPPAELYARLREGRGDVVLSAPAAGGEPGVLYTLPWGVSRHQIVARADTARIRGEADLHTRQIAVKRSSPLFARLARMAQAHPPMEIVEVPENVGLESLLDRVSTGRYDLAVADSMSLEPYLSRFLDLNVAYDLTDGEARSWAVRGNAVALLDSLNQFLNKRHLEIELARIYREDLPELEQRKMLRLITYQSPANYYFDRGRFRGFEYELVRRFADAHRMRLDVVIAHSHGEMRRLLLEGRGDLIAASLPEDSYSGEMRLASTRPSNYAAPVLIGREDDTVPTGPWDLDGRQVVLPAESPYRRELEDLQAQGIAVEIVEADPDLNTEGTLFRVARGLYDLTLIGSHQVKAELSRQINLKAHFELSESVPLAWIVRRADTQLKAGLNEYLAREFRKGYYNVLYSKYLENPQPRPGDTGLLANVDALSPFDDIVHEYAEHYGFDWRLIIALMFQESRFDRYAQSDAGAAGLMQILPATAELVGVNDLNNPRDSIEAGIRYLDHLRSQFEDRLLLENRTWFTLAAYNAGYQRVQRARRLAAAMKLDQDRWFDHVEKAMLALARPYQKDGEEVRDCRCGQTVVYVRDIRTRYNNYVRLTQSLRAASREAAAITRG